MVSWLKQPGGDAQKRGDTIKPANSPSPSQSLRLHLFLSSKTPRVDGFQLTLHIMGMDTDDDDSRGQAILIVTSIFLAISLVTVGLRCYVRKYVVRAFGWDDILMVVAMALNLAFAICGIVGPKYGLGRKLIHFITVPPSTGANNLRRALLSWWLGQIFYVSTCVVAKISIIITLLRITVDRTHAWILYAAISLATVVGLIFFFFTIFQCHPVSFFWDNVGKQGTCIDKELLMGIAYLYSVGAAVTDLTIGLLPIAVIWHLRMNSRTKAAIAGILGIGCIASAAVIIRIPFIKHYQDREFLYKTYQISIWSNVEAGLGITAGSLTTLRPLIRLLREGSSASRAYNQNPASYPMTGSVSRGARRATPSGRGDGEFGHKFWAGTEMDDYHGVTTTIMSSHQPNPTSSSEEDLNPRGKRWKGDG